MSGKRITETLKAEIEDLKAHLEEAQEALRAIRQNEVDALVVEGPRGPQIFTLQGAEQPYRIFVESMNEGAVTISPDGKILYSNRRFAEMTERTLNKVIGASFFDFLAPNHRDLFQDMVLKSDLDGSKREYLLVTANKKEMAVYLSVKPLTPEMENLCVVVTDLTVLKRAEEELLKSKEELELRVQERTVDLQAQYMNLKLADEKTKRLTALLQEERDRLSALINSMQEEVWFADTEGRFTLANQSAVRDFNLASPNRVMVERLAQSLEVFYPDGSPRPVEEAPPLRALQGEIVRNQEEMIRIPASGELRYREVNAAPVRDAANTIIGSVSVVRDVTERKRLEQELRKSRNDLELKVQQRTKDLRESEEAARIKLMEIETYYNMTPIGLCILDRELRYVRINERLAEINGLPVSTHLGRTIREVVPVIADMAEEMANRIMNTGESFSNIEFTVEAPDRPGIKRTSRSTWFPFKDTNGQVISFGVMVEEITEQRRLEEQLRQSHKMEAIGTFAGGIAHDFNNILAAIIGFAEMVEEDLPPESPSIPRIQRVLSAASRGSELVRQILAFSRKTEPTREPLSLSPLVKETIQFLRASLPTTIEINLTMKAARDKILASPAELQQVLMNLVTNASFAMREGGGILDINVNNVAFEPDSPILDTDVEPGEYVQLAVTDTGHGMEPHVMKRIFEPFFTTKEVGEGTGMGLPVVYGIVKSLHGAIAVESESGVGTTFKVYLPVARIDAKSEGGREQVIPKGTERILFVDDEEVLTEWGQAALERLGYTVTALTDSTEALSLFSSNTSRFDLVITDQTMPKLTGLNLAKKLLKIRPDIRIILCTGHSDSVSPEIAKEAGIKEFLMKPLRRKGLAEAIRRVIDTTESKG